MNIDFLRKCCQNDLLLFAQKSRWFAGKRRSSLGASLDRWIECSIDRSYLLTIKIDYDNDHESYLIPVVFTELDKKNLPDANAIIKNDRLENETTVLIDATYDESFRKTLFEQFTGRIHLKHLSTIRFRDIDEPYQSSQILKIDSTNTLLLFNEKYLFKLYRKLSSDVNDEMKMLCLFDKSVEFNRHVPLCYGAIVWLDEDQTIIASIIVQNFIRDANDCWTMITRCVEHPLSTEILKKKVVQLGQRIAEMHLNLFRLDQTNPDFSPERFNEEYCQSVTQNLIERLEYCFSQLIRSSSMFKEILIDSKFSLLNFIRKFNTRSFHSQRIRIHGDLHLGQVLFQSSNDDFLFIDFEVESTQPFRKHSPMKDVAAMVRSFHYASILTQNSWYESLRDTFLDVYLTHSSSLWINNDDESDYLFLFYSLDRTIHELHYEMNYRPEWIKIPLDGLIDIITGIQKSS